VRLIGERGLERTWLVGGGSLAAQLLAADLLDEVILTVAPTFVGRGPTLADGEFPLRRFALTEVSRWCANGARLVYTRERGT
jgi:riboflavin biosynthesis pyrimidine reductase